MCSLNKFGNMKKLQSVTNFIHTNTTYLIKQLFVIEEYLDISIESLSLRGSKPIFYFNK